ncbi:uncharacterized protein LOC116615576 [Nematostella vectensis]|uniref:uncharacterized protein LOC116615576 n=1 Tax=Nematostella vectensis TaxID=45351 RepID=UPI002076F6EC|nr:uncharacterized protein LOC116615576 [Nematostella vectensis]
MFNQSVFVLLLMLALAACKHDKTKTLNHAGDDMDHVRRSFLLKGKPIAYCLGAPGPPGPPGPPGNQGIPGRDGRDGRDCPPCNCASPAHVPAPSTPATPITEEKEPIEITVPHHACHHGHPSPPPPLSGPPAHGIGSAARPGQSCADILYQNPEATSGTYWLTNSYGKPYMARCEMLQSTCGGTDAGGWTLVARVAGLSKDFAPNSHNWFNHHVINLGTSADLNNPSSMKNPGWFSITSNVLRVCYSGPHSHCANFTHNQATTLAHLFGSKFAVQTTEMYTFEQLMNLFGKHLDVTNLKTQWCGLNLGNLCDLLANPNTHPGTHIVRIGCIGDTSIPRTVSGCNPDDYAIGIGVTSCNNPNGCHGTQEITKSLHFSSYPRHFGDYAQTAYIYVK